MRPEAAAKLAAFLGGLKTRPAVMGILNITPDSFSDGGRFLGLEAAIAQGRQLAADGCDILDIGGESTRPSATPVSQAEELARIDTVMGVLAGELSIPVSVDTYKAAVAQRALERGAVLVNDVFGLQHDAGMADAVARAGAGLVLVHHRPETDEAVDVIADMRRFFDHALRCAEGAGIPRSQILLDPGVGFAKTSRQNRDAVRRLAELADYGLPIVVGLSRKQFLGSLAHQRGIEGTLPGTLAASLAAIENGASVIRVHDVAAHAAALRVFGLLRRDSPGRP